MIVTLGTGDVTLQATEVSPTLPGHRGTSASGLVQQSEGIEKTVPDASWPMVQALFNKKV